MVDKISCSLSLMRRLPPNKIEQNLSGLLNLVPEETDELLQRVDQPLTEATDAEVGRPYLICDYNRDGDSYRSPWTNRYDPPLEDGFVPSDGLREIELEANELFDAYRDHYYEGGTSSVYLWDIDNGFAGCFLIKKVVSGDRFVREGSWDSIHIVEAIEDASGRTATYRLTTTVMLGMSVDRGDVGDTNLSGSLTRQTEAERPLNAENTHLSNIGRMIEDMEIDMRSNLDALYVQKTKEVVNSIRTTAQGPTQTSDHTQMLNSAITRHGEGRKTDSDA